MRKCDIRRCTNVAVFKCLDTDCIQIVKEFLCSDCDVKSHLQSHKPERLNHHREIIVSALNDAQKVSPNSNLP